MLEGELDGLEILRGGAVDVHARLHALVEDAEAESKVRVVGWCGIA